MSTSPSRSPLRPYPSSTPSPCHRRSRSPRHRQPRHTRRSTSSPRRSRTSSSDPSPPSGPRPPRLVVCPRFAGAPPLGEVGRGSGKARRGAHGAHLRGGAHPHPRPPQLGRPGGHHSARGMGGPPPRRGPGPPPPPHTPSPPPMAPGHPPQGLGHRRPPPTPPPPHREGEGHGQGEGKGQQGTLRQGGTEGQAPIGTGHPKRHNVRAGNHPGTRKGQERGPRHRGRGHHGRRRDPHPGRAYHDGGTSAAPPPAKAARLPGTHNPNTHRRSRMRTPYGSHQPTPTSHRKPHRGWRAHLHGENGLQPQRKQQGIPPRGAPPRPHHDVTTPAATRATSQAPEEDEGTATETRARD